MSSPGTNEAFADIREEIAAEDAADPAQKRLGLFFWVCVGFIVLVAFLATFASLLPLPNPDLGNYDWSRTRVRPGATCSGPTTSIATS